jgi:hypothetical protein
MKNKLLIPIIIIGVLFSASCNKILDQNPQGVIFPGSLSTPTNTDAMVIAAYSSLGNDHYTYPYTSMWPYGSVRGGDAYKGGNGQGDISEYDWFENFSTNRVDNDLIDQLWYNIYVGIARANEALALVNSQDTSVYPLKVQRQAEMRFLRGHFYFLLKILYKYIPYIDETISKNNYASISNRVYTNDSLWGKIAADFSFAAANLPNSQTDLGRPNKYAAEAYLAKTLLYRAYQQDENNNVTGLNLGFLSQVNTLCDDVINNGGYSLNSDFSQNFLSSNRNGKESIFAIQYSINDGTPHGRLDYGHVLSYPMYPSYGCCGFHVPSHDLINAFQTDSTGLPEFSTYNNNDVATTHDWHTGTFDPRLDHTVAIPGHPYKYMPTVIFDSTWARAAGIYGAFASMKEVVSFNDPNFEKVPPFMSSAKNWDIIRLDDVMLFKAEALIQLSQQNSALPLINALRTRSASSTALLVTASGTPTSNYGIKTYQPGVNCTWTQNFALQALMFERRLEFATEGYHFFDLVRWGIAAETMNAYFAEEKTKSAHLAAANFTKGRDEYFPIPLNQMNFSQGVYKQNTGW